MTAHKLARVLLQRPDIPVVINGWGSDEGFTFEVNEVSPPSPVVFSGVGDTKETPRDPMGYQEPRQALMFGHCDHTPYSDEQILKFEAVRLKAQQLKETDPELYHKIYAEITPITPEQMMQWTEDNRKQIL